MKDFQGRDVVIGNGILYAVSGRLVSGVIVDMDGDQLTVEKDGGGKSTITATEDKIYLLH